jgi:DNA-binding transcriptional regulator YiaG
MPKPDKPGSRAARTAHFSRLLIAWRTRGKLSSADAAIILCCTERTIADWEAQRRMPTGINLRAITDVLTFRHHLKGERV